MASSADWTQHARRSRTPSRVQQYDTDMMRKFDTMQQDIDRRSASLHEVSQALATMETKTGLFDEEDLQITARVATEIQADIETRQAELNRIKTLYTKEVLDIERMLKEKEELLKSTPAVSAQTTLLHHFARKQATQLKALQEVRDRLCANM